MILKDREREILLVHTIGTYARRISYLRSIYAMKLTEVNRFAFTFQKILENYMNNVHFNVLVCVIF